MYVLSVGKMAAVIVQPKEIRKQYVPEAAIAVRSLHGPLASHLVIHLTKRFLYQ